MFASPNIPDPLLTTQGQRIATAADWETLRRPELLEAFRSQIYGRNAVERPAGEHFELLDKATPAFNGLAVRRRVRVAYQGPGGKGGITLTSYAPTQDHPPKGCFLLIVNRSKLIIDEAETNPSEFWPVQDLIERGYATVAFHYSDAALDCRETGLSSGVFEQFGPPADARPGDAWGTIAAWSWAASRAIDWLRTDDQLAGVPIAVIGHSRGGKAALWCGAQDKRVALTISNNSGCSGAAMARTKHGETVKAINASFPHWFSTNYRRYADREADLPVDQHELLALMAPRLVYVASATEDDTADPQAEFKSCVEAAPVYALYGLAGAGSPAFPQPGETRHAGAIGYHLRQGGHSLEREDWSHYLDYADAWLAKMALLAE